MKTLLLILIWLCILLPGYSYEIPPEYLDSLIDQTGEYLFFDESFDNRPSVALVLSGGGAHGFAHVGAIRVLEEAGIPIDLVIGTSMGALVGTLYSVGYSPGDMEENSELTDWRQIFTAPSGVIPYMTMPIFDSRYNILAFYFDSQGIGRSLGLLYDQQIVAQLSRLTHKMSHVRNFDELPIPLRIVGADLLTGEAVAFDRGPLHAPMRGTMAIPGLFSPHYIDGRYIVDGGAADNLPVLLARLMGADIVIAVRAMSEWRDTIDGFSSAMTVIAQAGQIAISNPLINEEAISDLFIDVSFPETAILEFWKYEDFIAIGEQAAREMGNEIEQLADRIGKDRELDFRDPDRKGTYVQLESPVISGVEIAPSLQIDDFPLELFQEVVGQRINTEDIEHIADRLVSSRQYESIGYSVREENGNNYLSIYPIILSRGKHYFGATFFFDGSYAYGFEDPWNIKPGFSFDLVISELIGRGTHLAVTFQIEDSLHTNVQFTIPLTPSIYVEPFVSFGEKGYLSQDEQMRAVYLEVGQEAGIQLQPYSRVGVTLFLSGAWSEDTGEGDVQLAFSPRLDIQSYEPSRFPLGGLRCRTRLDIPMLPDDSWFHRFGLEVKHFFPIYRNGVFGWDLTIDSSGYDGPDEFKELLGERTQLGGWDAVPGYTPDTLVYSDALMGGVTFSHRFPTLSGILEMDIFGIGQVRAGVGWDDIYHAWDDRSFYGGISLGIGVDSLLGELVVGAGVSLKGNVGFYLLLN